MKEIKKLKKNPRFFISMATAAKFVLPIPILLAYLVPLDVDVTGNITAKLCEVWSEFNIFCTLVTVATAPILNFFQKLPYTTVDIPTKFNEDWLPWPLRQSLSNRFRFFFGLSRSTRYGCCSYQVSSTSFRRLTCYDHFGVFQFFSILAVSMAMTAILKKSNLKSTTSHGI